MQVTTAALLEQRKAVHMAMSLVPHEEKAAYLEAMEAVPHLVDLESDPAAFLRVEHQQAEAAAGRLARHWDLRKKLFQERAFRSILDLSDEGALPKEDRDVLKAGFFLSLLKDSAGRSIIFIDEHEIPVSFLEFKRMRPRLVFYVQIKFAVENSLSQTDGIRCLRVLRTPAIDLPGFRLLQQKIDTCMHLKLYDYIFIGIPPPGGRQHFRRTLLPLIQQVPFTFGYSQIIMGNNREKMLAELLEKGFCKDQLPPVLGGTWSHDAVESWFSANQGPYSMRSPVSGQECPPAAASQKKRISRRRELIVSIPAEARVVHVVAHKDRKTVDHTYRDYSQVPPDADYTGEPDDVAQMSFVQKVYHMLQAQNLNDYIWWLPHGRAFMLGDLYELEESQILFKYFGIQRAAIFVLLLGSYGFKRLTSGIDRGAFYHECMLRNLPHLLKLIPAPRDNRLLKPDMENEPCFYSISTTFPLAGSTYMQR